MSLTRISHQTFYEVLGQRSDESDRGCPVSFGSY